MEDDVKKSWERFLHPKTLKENIINASIFSMAFEMLKTSIIEKIEGFYINGFDENGMIVSPEYKEKVLSLDKSRLYASLKWLLDRGAINEDDLAAFEYVKRCRNTLTHEMLTFASSGVDFNVSEAFEKLAELLRKVEIWWFVNLEMEIDPDAYPPNLNIDEVTPGPIWSLQMLIDIALGPEDKANLYYENFVSESKKT